MREIVQHKKTHKRYAVVPFPMSYFTHYGIDPAMMLFYRPLNPKTGAPWQAQRKGKRADFQVVRNVGMPDEYLVDAVVASVEVIEAGT